MTQPVLMVFALRGNNRKAIPFAAMRLGIRLKPVAPAQYGQTLEALLDAPALKDAAEGGFEEEMLVMANFTPALAGRFLNELKRLGAAPIARKAVLTPTNRGWNARQLYEELGREHEAIKNTARAHEDPPAQ
ncbi:MAG: DUF3783 domain-containing protein [Clostridia bacterium]|nr:DUF3783 domain-containing protein [Clostridia bacterium]